MPISEKQLDANRPGTRLRVSLQSTGPRTPEGKQIVRLNGLKHGLRSQDIVITRDDFSEDPEEFATLLDRLQADCAPQGPLEEVLVQQMATCLWRLRRALKADTILFGQLLSQQELAATGPSIEDGVAYPREMPALPYPYELDPLLRYESALQRSFSRALSQLQRHQAHRTASPLPALEALPAKL